jgi:hypothetical protein
MVNPLNYNDIVDTALKYADRQDSTLVTAQMDNFMRIVESRMNRLLTIEDMSMRYQFPFPNPTDGRYELPVDFSALQDISIVTVADTTQRNTLLLVNPEQMNDMTNTQNIPASAKRFYNIIANQLVIQPVIDDTYILEIVYYGNVLPLTGSAPNNWVATNHPDCYIFGLLVEINSFMKDPAATQGWDARFTQTIAEMTEADEVLVYSGTPLTTKVG